MRRLLWAAPLALAVVAGILAGVAVAAAIHMPRVDALADFTPSLITQLSSRQGEVFATFAKERRFLLDEVPPVLQNALVAAEDSNFFQHGGIDLRGIVRAALRNLEERRFGFGGSTLTMQLARTLFLTREKTWRRKIEEALLAVELEKRFSKQQILTLYCNMVNVGHGNYGMESAARYYFNKSAAQLTVPEAAMLAGIVQRPSDFSPYRRPERVKARRDYVLRRMFEDGYITEEAYRAGVTQPLLVVTRHASHRLAPYFAEEIRKYLEAKYGSETVLERGLAVQTTLDVRIQRAAERALQDGLTRIDRRKGWRGAPRHLESADLEAEVLPSWGDVSFAPDSWNEGLVLETRGSRARVKIGERTLEIGPEAISWTHRRRPGEILHPGDVAWFRVASVDEDGTPRLVLEQEPELEGAVVVLESSTGAVRALVGGWSFERSQFNRVTQAHRQVGSAFKPFVVGTALESGLTPADTLFDAPAVFRGAENEPSYSPRNFYPRYYGILTIRRALELSINVTSVKLLDLVGGERVVDFARRAGIRSPLHPFPSLALGAVDLTPLELAAAYAAIANQGIYVEPYLIENLALGDGRVLESHVPRAQRAMDAPVAYVLTQMLHGVIERGTGKAASKLPLDLAGKTGTTDSFIDAWFVGFTPRLTLLAWVGYDVNRSIGRNMTGAVAALPIWKSVIERGLEEGWIRPDERFTQPPGVVVQPVEYLTGLLPGPGAERVIDEYFLEGTEPARRYEPRWSRIMALPWYQQRPFYIPKQGEAMPDDVADWSVVQAAWADDEDS